MTRVEIFKKWSEGNMSSETAIAECKKAPKPNRIQNDYDEDSWALYDGDEDNLSSSLWLMVDCGECKKEDMERFFKEVILVADKDVPKKKPDFKAAKEVGFDVKQLRGNIEKKFER